MRFAGAAMSSDYTGATGKDTFVQASKKAPNFGNLAQQSMVEASKEKQTALYAQGQVASSGIQSLGAATEAENNAKAGIAKAEAEASATQMGGVMDMFKGLAGGAVSLNGNAGSGGAWKDATDIGFAGNQVNDLGRIRY